MFRTRSHEDFVKDFNERREDSQEYTFESEYIASNAMIRVRHLLCDTVFETTPVQLTRSRSPMRCTTCAPSQNQKKSIEEVKEEVRRYGNGAFTLVNDNPFDGLHYLTIEHDVCGYQFQVYRNNMLTWGLSCPNCNEAANRRDKRVKRHEEMANRVNYLSDGRYSLVSEYDGYAKPVDVRNEETGEVTTMTYSALIQRIKREFPNNTRDKEKEWELKQNQIKARILKDSFGRYELISDYHGSDENVEIYDRRTGEKENISYAALHARIKKMNTQHQVYRDEYEKSNTDYTFQE